jgi:hypothetical protein
MPTIVDLDSGPVQPTSVPHDPSPLPYDEYIRGMQDSELSVIRLQSLTICDANSFSIPPTFPPGSVAFVRWSQDVPSLQFATLTDGGGFLAIPCREDLAKIIDQLEPMYRDGIRSAVLLVHSASNCYRWVLSN